MKKTLLLLLAGWMFVLLIWVQTEQHLTSVKHDQQYVKQMQLEHRARAIANYGGYEE